MDEAEKARRRKLALQKLARVFKGDEPARVPASNAYGVLAERKILTTILRTTHQPEIASLVRDRLAVISLDSDSDSDDDAPASNPTVAANEATDRLEATKSAEVTAWLRESRERDPAGADHAAIARVLGRTRRARQRHRQRQATRGVRRDG